METCCLLKEYMLLVDKIRKYAAEYKDINRAAEQAVTECIEENILADFLRKNRTEAIEVCIFEYDEKREKELIRKAEYAEGKKEGLREGQKHILFQQAASFQNPLFFIQINIQYLHYQFQLWFIRLLAE